MTRDSLCKNERALIHAINNLGSRVGVDVVHLHLASLYEFMKIPIDGNIAAISVSVSFMCKNDVCETRYSH